MKHNELLEWRGRAYRYNKTYGYLKLVSNDKTPRHWALYPPLVYEICERWECDSHTGTTPMEALEGWRKNQLLKLERRIKETQKQLHSLQLRRQLLS